MESKNIIDINYLFFRQQVEMSLAENSTEDEHREAHRELADLYTKIIARQRDVVFPRQY